MTQPHVDVLIVGAGISGIGAACRVTRERPGTSFLVLERRQAIGGTWDLFRYPGVRSDSDMMTFGYDFRPWTDTKILADGPSIRQYVRDTAAEYGVDEHIRFGTRMTTASWSTPDGRWTVEAVDEASGDAVTFTADFLLGCGGYYDYDHAYRPAFPGEDRYAGTFVHPQFWPEDLDYRGKRVLIIGSGATAITLVPAMAGDAGHVTMLQRSPSYILSLPERDPMFARLQKVVPAKVAYKITRARNIGLQRVLYALARAKPDLVRSRLRREAERQLGGSVDIENFTPRYDPWDQRLCIVPDGDLYAALRSGAADVVTGTIKTFTETGVELDSGQRIDADIVVTATGLTVQLLGGASLVVDGEPVSIRDRVTYKGVLLEGLPNAAIVFGYINASWTLKADIAAEYVCRLLAHMQDHGYTQVVATAGDADRDTTSVMGALNSGYVRRGDAVLPRQGTHGPWKVRNDYLRDAAMLKFAPVGDGALRFSTAPRGSVEQQRARSATPTT